MKTKKTLVTLVCRVVALVLIALVWGITSCANGDGGGDGGDGTVGAAAGSIQVAAPTAAPGAGEYAVTQTVTLVTATPGADIYYTLNGTTPPASSTPYTAPVKVKMGTTLKAIAVKAGMTDSAVLTAVYTLSGSVVAPTASPDAGDISLGQAITLSTTADGATIYYTTDGSEPDRDSTEYTRPFPLTGLPATVKAIAVKYGMVDSAVLEAAYTQAAAAAPAASPDAGDIRAGQAITLSTATDGVTIYYTTDGSEPDRDSTEYTGPFPLTGLPATLKAIAVKDGMIDSAVLEAAYTQAAVAAPAASPETGEYAAPQTVTLATATSGADIYYTTDGSEPDRDSTPYTGPITVSIPTPLKAIAVADGMTDSAVLEAAYTRAFTTPAVYRTMVSLTGGSPTPTSGSSVFIAGRPVPINAFQIAKYETTYQLWKEVYDWATVNGGYTFSNRGVEGHGTTGTGTVGDAGTRATRPVTTINWRDAIVWCNAYSEMSGKTPVYYTDDTCTTPVKVSTSGTATDTADGAKMKSDANGYRLPTEAEWEYAARGGNQGNAGNWGYTYAGSDAVDDVAWYKVNSFDVTSDDDDYGAHPVGTQAENSAHLFDMSGNVREWCWDWYDTITTGTPVTGADSGSGSQPHRILRGGSCNYSAVYCTVFFRDHNTPRWGEMGIGFRVVCP